MTLIYRDWVAQWTSLLKAGRILPSPLASVTAQGDAPASGGGSGGRVILFSPHPDDECLSGVLPLRLVKESKVEVLNYAVTLGSKEERKAERRQELEAAVSLLGFRSCLHEPLGWDAVNETTRREDSPKWSVMVGAVANFIRDNKPVAIFLPSLADDHPTHRGTHYLVKDALASLQPEEWRGYLVESAYWGALPNPNLFVEVAEADVALLVEACACHRGEVARNAYHLRLPALLIDSVRRAEMVVGPGGIPPATPFGFLYSIDCWNGNKTVSCCPHGFCIESGESASLCFLVGES